MSVTPSALSRPIAWTIWLMVSIFYAYQYILRVMPNIMLSDIMSQFQMNSTLFGQFSGIYYIGYALMHLPLGIMLDRFGPKKVIPACILLSVVGLMPLLFASHWVWPIMGRLLMGLGSSAAILGVFKILRLSFNQKQFPRFLSLSVTIGLAGAIYGGAPVSYLNSKLGYQAVIELFALVGLVLAAITYWAIPELKSTPQGKILAPLKEVLSHKKVMLACLCAGCMVGPLEGFADVWGAVFLKQVYLLDKTVSATLPSLIFIGMCFGAPLLNFIADKLGCYLKTIIGAGLLMSACFAALLFLPLSIPLITLNFICVGAACAYQILAIYQASTYVREEIAGLTTALANMIIMLFGYGFHALIGAVVNTFGGPTVSKALIYGISVIPLALFLGTSGFMALLRRSRVNQTA